MNAISTAVLGDGHFLGDAHTLAAMERDYFHPSLANRDYPKTWEEKGAPDAWSTAQQKAKDILATHHPEYLSAAQNTAIRNAFRILD